MIFHHFLPESRRSIHSFQKSGFEYKQRSPALHGDKAGLHDQSRRRPTLTRAILSLPSARQRFTAGFGTGPGGTTGLRSPGFRAEAPVFWGGGVRSACPGVSRGGMMGIDLLLFWTRRQGKKGWKPGSKPDIRVAGCFCCYGSYFPLFHTMQGFFTIPSHEDCSLS